MKTLIGGAVAALVGLIGLAIWFKPFLNLLAGCIPIGLLIGGGLALYLGFDELKEIWQKDDSEAPAEEDPEDLKQKLEALEKENAELKAKS